MTYARKMKKTTLPASMWQQLMLIKANI